MPNEIVNEQPTSDSSCDTPAGDSNLPDSVSSYLKKKVPKFIPPLKKALCKKIQTSGREITSTDLAKSLVEAKTSSAKTEAKSKPKFETPLKKGVPATSVPGPSKTVVPPVVAVDPSSDSDTDSDMTDEDKCCVCNKFYVNRSDIQFIKLISWGQCDFQNCGHWVHLKYCTSVRVLRRNEKFICPCHI